MSFEELLDWLDNSNPSWRECVFIQMEMDLMEEMLVHFLRKNPDWIDELVPPCLQSEDRLEWVCALFASQGPAVEPLIWSIFGFCQSEMVDDFCDREGKICT